MLKWDYFNICVIKIMTKRYLRNLTRILRLNSDPEQRISRSLLFRSDFDWSVMQSMKNVFQFFLFTIKSGRILFFSLEIFCREWSELLQQPPARLPVTAIGSDLWVQLKFSFLFFSFFFCVGSREPQRRTWLSENGWWVPFSSMVVFLEKNRTR